MDTILKPVKSSPRQIMKLQLILLMALACIGAVMAGPTKLADLVKGENCTLSKFLLAKSNCDQGPNPLPY